MKPLFIVQAVITLWDKGQQSEMHARERDASPDRYRIGAARTLEMNDLRVCLDVHGGDRYRQITCSTINGGAVLCDRLLLNPNDGGVAYLGTPHRKEQAKWLGKPVGRDWLQCRYDWRYRVHREGWFYWLYEKVSLNVTVCETSMDSIFVDSPPASVFEDFALSR